MSSTSLPALTKESATHSVRLAGRFRRSSVGLLSLSLVLAASTFACSSADAPGEATAVPETPSPDDSVSQDPATEDADGGGGVAPDDEAQGPGDVTKKTEGEPEIVSWSSMAITKDNLFPTYLSANIANVGHLTRNIVIKNPSSEKKRFILRAALQGFTKSETPFTIDLQPGETQSFWADSALDYEALSKISSPTDAAITVTLTSTEGNLFYSAAVPVKVLPKGQVFWRGVFSDSTLGGKFDEGTRERIAVVGTMTTPHDKDGYIDALLQKAAQLTESKSLSGYQQLKSNTTLEQASQIVGIQAKAIYDALHNMGVNYTSVDSNFFVSNSGQNVRYPAESLRAKTANCIDGALVFASAFEALGLDSDIVFVPGHAFVGVHLGPPGTSFHDNTLFIETTVVATRDYTSANKIALDNYKGKYKGVSLRIALSAVREGFGFLPFPM